MHNDLVPQNIIFQLISPFIDSQGNPREQVNGDFHSRFKIKLGEYLNIKTLSDIAFQKTMLISAKNQGGINA